MNKGASLFSPRVSILVLFLVSVFQYSVALRNDFVWDARAAIIEDPSIREFRYAPFYFKEDFSKHAPHDSGMVATLKYYRPLSKMLFLLEYNLFGSRPFGYNAVNILLNAVVVILCYLFVLASTGSPPVAFFSVLLYAVNPNRAEAVSWVYSASYLLAALFSLLSLLFYQRRKYSLAIVMFALSLFSQESAVMLPAVILLYEFFVNEKRSLKDYFPAVLFFCVLGLFLAVRTAAVGRPPFTELKFGVWANTVAVVVKRYVKIFFIPDGVVTLYPKNFFAALSPETVASYIVLAFLIGIGILLHAKKRAYLFWYLWFFIWLALAFNIGKFAEYLMAEKTLYLASLGFCVLITLLIFDLLANNRRLPVIVLAVFIAGQSVMTFQKNLYWKDTETYLEKGLEFAPGFYLAHYALGCEYASKGAYEKALTEFKKTVASNPSYSYAYNNMGNIYLMEGSVDLAISVWHEAIRVDPANPNPYFNLGLAAEKRGNLNDALRYYRALLSLTPMPPPEIANHADEIEAHILKKGG